MTAEFPGEQRGRKKCENKGRRKRKKKKEEKKGKKEKERDEQLTAEFRMAVRISRAVNSLHGSIPLREDTNASLKTR